MASSSTRQKKEKAPLNAKDRRPLYRQVEEYLELLIHERGLKPGEAIPSLTQLSSLLGVNGLTIRRAIRELTYKQVLVTLQGRGTFVAEGAIKRLLWVSGLDIFAAETSTSYSNLFRAVSRECAKHSLRLEPVWLPGERDFEALIDANGGEGAISGYFFSACKEDHRLYNFIRQSGKPYISTSITALGKPRTVLPDIRSGDRMALEYFRGKGGRQVSYFFLGGDENLTLHMSDPMLDAQPIPWYFGGNRVKVEACAYLRMRDLLASGGIHSAIYVTDDVAARGVTRALLELPESQRLGFDILVRSRLQDVTPHGVPVHYLVYDLEEQATYALEMLLDQISGKEKIVQHLCPYRLLSADSSWMREIRQELFTAIQQDEPALR